VWSREESTAEGFQLIIFSLTTEEHRKTLNLRAVSSPTASKRISPCKNQADDYSRDTIRAENINHSLTKGKLKEKTETKGSRNFIKDE
jgi:hypothetical protein